MGKQCSFLFKYKKNNTALNTEGILLLKQLIVVLDFKLEVY